MINRLTHSALCIGLYWFALYLNGNQSVKKISQPNENGELWNLTKLYQKLICKHFVINTIFLPNQYLFINFWQSIYCVKVFLVRFWPSLTSHQTVPVCLVSVWSYRHQPSVVDPQHGSPSLYQEHLPLASCRLTAGGQSGNHRK